MVDKSCFIHLKRLQALYKSGNQQHNHDSQSFTLPVCFGGREEFVIMKTDTENDYVGITIQIPQSVRDWLEKLSLERDQSVAAVVRTLLKQAMETKGKK
jgi:hypothetical protein